MDIFQYAIIFLFIIILNSIIMFGGSFDESLSVSNDFSANVYLVLTLNTIVLLTVIMSIDPSIVSEPYATLSNEAIADIAEVYTKQNMIVDNLTVKNNITTGGLTANSATIGNWNIRNDAIGIPSRKDINMTDWIRIYDYGTNKYSGTGVAANAFWENGMLTDKYVTYNRNVSAKPVNDFGKCFDFGSDHRTDCSNGWSVVQMIPR